MKTVIYETRYSRMDRVKFFKGCHPPIYEAKFLKSKTCNPECIDKAIQWHFYGISWSLWIGKVLQHKFTQTLSNYSDTFKVLLLNNIDTFNELYTTKQKWTLFFRVITNNSYTFWVLLLNKHIFRVHIKQYWNFYQPVIILPESYHKTTRPLSEFDMPNKWAFCKIGWHFEEKKWNKLKYYAHNKIFE